MPWHLSKQIWVRYGKPFSLISCLPLPLWLSNLEELHCPKKEISYTAPLPSTIYLRWVALINPANKLVNLSNISSLLILNKVATSTVFHYGCSAYYIRLKSISLAKLFYQI